MTDMPGIVCVTPDETLFDSCYPGCWPCPPDPSECRPCSPDERRYPCFPTCAPCHPDPNPCHPVIDCCYPSCFPCAPVPGDCNPHWCSPDLKESDLN